ELPGVAAVVENAVDHPGDDLRPAVHRGDDVVQLPGAQASRIARPARFLAPVMEREAKRSAARGGERDPDAGVGPRIQEDLARIRGVEAQPEVQRETAPEVPAAVVWPGIVALVERSEARHRR